MMQVFYHRARWYDPQARRFISEDPIGLDGGINLYAYVENNPLNMVDPYGNWGWLIRLGQWASQTPADEGHLLSYRNGATMRLLTLNDMGGKR